MTNNFVPFTSDEIVSIMANRHVVKQDKQNPPMGLKVKVYRFNEAWSNYNQ